MKVFFANRKAPRFFFCLLCLGMSALPAAPQAYAQSPSEAEHSEMEAAADSAYALYYQSRYSEMIPLLEESLQKADGHAPAETYGLLYHLMGVAYIRMGDLEQALVYTDLSLQKYTEVDDTCNISEQLSCLAAIYMMNKQSEKCLPYIEKAIEIERANNGCGNLSARLGMLCDIEINLGHFSDALQVIQEALAIDSSAGDEVRTAYRRSQTGEVYKNLERYAEAEEQCLLALRVFEEKEILNSQAITWRQLASIYHRTRRSEQSTAALLRCIEICRTIGNIFLEQRCYNDLSECSPDPVLALEYFKKSVALKDSIYNKETQAKLDEFQVKYETREKELQIERQRAELERRKTEFIILVLSVLLLLVVAALCITLYVLQRKHSKRLRQEIDAQNLFLAILSHDLKNPVQAQCNVLEMLYRQSDTVLDNKDLLLACLEKLYKSSRHQLDMLYRMLDWGRLRLGRMEPHAEVFDLEERMRKAAEWLDAELLEKNISLKFSCEAPAKTVYADKRMIETVLRNLLDNAAKFSPKDACIEVKLYAPAADRLAISITDHGEGMEPSQIPSSEMPGKTGGLGLVICRQMLSLNKGVLSIESSPGQGTVCSFTLPTPKN